MTGREATMTCGRRKDCSASIFYGLGLTLLFALHASTPAAQVIPWYETFETNPPMAGTDGPGFSIDTKHGWVVSGGAALIVTNPVYADDQAASLSNTTVTVGFTNTAGFTNVWDEWYVYAPVEKCSGWRLKSAAPEFISML